MPVPPRSAPGAPPRHILSASQRMRAVRVNMPAAAPPRRMPQPARPTRAPRQDTSLWLIGGLAVFAGVVLLCMTVTLGGVLMYGAGILPGVSAGGIALGGMSRQEAESALRAEWSALRLRDGDRLFTVDPAALGVQFDAAATADTAYRQGRGSGNALAALVGVDIAPVVVIDSTLMTSGLEALRAQVDLPPVNAGVALVAGVVQPTAPQNGRSLDVTATAARLQSGEGLASGEGVLVMQEVAPAVTDSAPMLQAAQQLLTGPLTVTAYDPATGDSVRWSAAPETWAGWLTSTSAPGTATGLVLSVQAAPLRDFLTAQSQVFDSTRTLNLDEAIAQVQAAVAANTTEAVVRVYHRDRQHVVQAGETIVSIAYAYGVPYPFVQQANGGIEALSVGQTITIPSVDTFLPYEVVPNKRIVVSIPQQRVRVYQDGQMIQDWPASTGISSSPTWPGVYQILSHEPNAYAANWDLWMPHFMGVYQPVPGTDFTNGFHGFPTRGGGQLLWENSLGTRVTYGCILLSNTNVQWLYTWAETGVVVEIEG